VPNARRNDSWSLPPPGASTGDQNGPLNGCPVFPANNYWNTPVDTLPVHAASAAWVNSIGRQIHGRIEQRIHIYERDMLAV